MSTNIDFSEINKFSQMASQWWDPNGECKPLHIINPLRVEYIQKQCGNLAHKKLLDVGCGGGILSESLAKLDANVTGLDMSLSALNVAREHAKQNQLTVEYLHTSVEQHAKQFPQHYDVITCMEMLEHVPSPQSIISACATLLKPNGKLFLSTINRNIKAKMLLIFGAEYIAKLVPKGTHDFEKFIRPAELMHFVEQAHLQNRDIIGIEYQLLKNEFRLSDNVDVNYILMAKKY